MSNSTVKTNDIGSQERLASHTPGPWSVAGHDSNGQRIVHGEHIEVCTCWHHCVGALEQEMEANARLIAAAPELLEALERLLLQYEGVYDCVDNHGKRYQSQGAADAEVAARAAIAKARRAE